MKRILMILACVAPSLLCDALSAQDRPLRRTDRPDAVRQGDERAGAPSREELQQRIRELRDQLREMDQGPGVRDGQGPRGGQGQGGQQGKRGGRGPRGPQGVRGGRGQGGQQGMRGGQGPRGPQGMRGGRGQGGQQGMRGGQAPRGSEAQRGAGIPPAFREMIRQRLQQFLGARNGAGRNAMPQRRGPSNGPAFGPRRGFGAQGQAPRPGPDAPGADAPRRRRA